MTTPATSNISVNVSIAVLLGNFLGVVNEQWQSGRLMDDGLLCNSSINITDGSNNDEQTDGALASLLMPVWAYQSAGAYLTFISIVGLLMNITVIIVILNDPQRMTLLNFMLLNLACSDGIIAGFGTPISAAAAFQLGWPFSDELCVAYAMVMSTTGIGSIATLTALALWRCQLVVYCPAKRSGGGSTGNLSRVQAAILLTLIWAYSLAVTCPPLFGWGRYDREAAHLSCSVNWESKMDNNRSYILYMFAFGLFVPLVAIICSYVSILRVLKKTKEMRIKMQASTTGYSMNEKRQKSQRNSNTDAAERRVTVMVACMIGAFLAAWTPYSIMALFETFIGDGGHSGNEQTNVSSSVRQPEDEEKENFVNYVGTISPAFATIPSLFAKTSAVLNPLIYGILNTQFRSAWEKFSTRCLRQPRHRRYNSQVMTRSNKINKNKQLCEFLNCASGDSPIRSASLHLSVKEIGSNESQSAYVMVKSGGKQATRLFYHDQIAQEGIIKFEQPENINPATFSRETSVTPIRKNRAPHPFNSQQEEQQEQKITKLVVVRIQSESTSCTINGDQNVVTTTLEEEVSVASSGNVNWKE